MGTTTSAPAPAADTPAASAGPSTPAPSSGQSTPTTRTRIHNMRLSTPHSSGVNLLNLPEEVLQRVLVYLGPQEMAAAVKTCHAFKDIYDSSSQLRYQSAMAHAGYVDVPPRADDGADARPGSASSSGRGNGNDDEACSAILAASYGEPRPLETAVKSPHTGRPRPTLASVSLAAWPTVPPRTRADYSRLTPAGKNMALRSREERWDKFAPAQVRTFRVQGRTGVYELQEGIFLMCEMIDTRDKPTIIRLIPLPSAEDPDLENTIVPTMAHHVKFAIADLTMDPTQDLIVVSEFEPEAIRDELEPPAHRFHLMSMSAFEPHPLARLATLDFPPASVPTLWPRQLLQVMGDTLVAHISREGVSIMGILQDAHAILANDSEEEMVAWNWKTGKVMGRIHLGRTLTACTFCMLTPTTVAVAMPASVRSTTRADQFVTEVIDEASITIYSFAQPSESDVKQPLSRDAEDDTTPRAVLVARLRLPDLANGVALENFHMRPDPSAMPTQPGVPTLGGGKPFTLNPDRGVVVIELTIGFEDSLQDQQSENFELFVLRETLVELAEEGEAARRAEWAKFGPGAEPDPVTYEWSTWGEENARLLPATQGDGPEARRPWVCSCAGYRFVSLVTVDSDFGGDPQPIPFPFGADDPGQHPKALVVSDFNPYIVARARAESAARGGVTQWTETTDVPEDEDEGQGAWGADEYTVMLHDEPSTIPAGESFADDVTSSLPYRTVRRALTGLPNGVMIDDQRVLIITTTGMPTSWRSQRQEVKVLCF